MANSWCCEGHQAIPAKSSVDKHEISNGITPRVFRATLCLPFRKININRLSESLEHAPLHTLAGFRRVVHFASEYFAVCLRKPREQQLDVFFVLVEVLPVRADPTLRLFPRVRFVEPLLVIWYLHGLDKGCKFFVVSLPCSRQCTLNKSCFGPSVVLGY